MAIITDADVKEFVGVRADMADFDAFIAAARLAGEADVRRITGRNFQDAGATSARVFRPESSLCCWVDDFSTTVGLIVKTDEDGDGVFETTWTSSDYELHPLNGRMNDEAWPYCRLEAVDSSFFPVGNGRLGTVQVTARWGWATVPDAVKFACRILAASDERVRALIKGEGGFTKWSREHAVEMLAPYVHPTHRLGVA